MRRSRERRRKGQRALMVALRKSEVEALVRRGWLGQEERADPIAIRKALYGFLDQQLVAASAPFRATAKPKNGAPGASA
jgi:hypothetical protein